MSRLLVFVAAIGISSVAIAKDRLPNIVILFADDLGYGELGCQNVGKSYDIPTPNIDSIAKNGVRFTNGYVTAPFCSASRAGLLTGRYQTRFGYEFNPIGAKNHEPNIGLPKSETTLAQLAQRAGHATALIGKWHLGAHPKNTPLRRGFDEFFGFLHEGHYFVPPPYRGVTTMLRRTTLPGGAKGPQRWIRPDGKLILTTHMGHSEPAYDADNPILRAGQPVEEKKYLTDAFTREAVSFIQRHKSRPFLLFLSYNAVHSPLQATDADMQRFRHIKDVHRRIFAGMLHRMDVSVGKVLQTLRDEKLEKDTIVFFLSDNGGPTRELTSSNTPLRGGKGTVYEGGLRVPFLVQWKGRIRPRTVSEPVISLDIYKTVAALLKQPAKRSDGVDLLPVLTGKQKKLTNRSLFWRIGNRSALRSGDWKIVRNHRRRTDAWELYNLSRDVGEANDLAKSESKRLDALLKQWLLLNSKMVEPAWR